MVLTDLAKALSVILAHYHDLNKTAPLLQNASGKYLDPAAPAVRAALKWEDTKQARTNTREKEREATMAEALEQERVRPAAVIQKLADQYYADGVVSDFEQAGADITNFKESIFAD